jgi:dihydroorotate dehydrogenase electron transfer subunit
MLRRPFSIAGFRRDADHCEIELLGRVAGPGTAWLAACHPGDAVDILGPLGRPFSHPPAGAEALLVAGGIGLPPIRWLGEELTRQGVACEAVYGAQARDLMPITLALEPPADGSLSLCVREFASLGIPAMVTTDDGSCGVQGPVTKGVQHYLLGRQAAAPLYVYACGPEAMLRAVALLCRDRGLPCEVAMERMMACGMGTCQSCVVRVVDETTETGWRYALCCTEGPVFNATKVLWR